MIRSISDVCKKEGCTRQELIRIAISRMLFEKSKSLPEANISIHEDVYSNPPTNVENSSYDIPLDKIISVRYTLDDGKVIHIMRGKKQQ
jgi:GTP cyclohydrolase FolE2